MAARRQTDQENSPVNRFGGADEEDIQRYLDMTDDGELSRLAAMMAPKGETFDARALIEQAAALQAEAAAELVRRREARVESMSLATLSELARRLGVHEPGFLGAIHEDSLMDDDPILGPILRRLSARMRAMPPPQDFANLFLAENPTEALNRASGRTSLRRPPPDANLEELLRFAANIPGDEVSWDILNGAFLDFLQIWFQDRLDLEELIQGGPDSGPTKSKGSSVLDRIERLQRNRTRFYESFKPGHEFPPDIVELAHRAYTECWEDGILRSQWHRRLAWLAEEFPPFWQKLGEAYRAIHQDQIKAVADAKARLRREENKKSAKARESGEAGLQSREGNRWRKVTTEFIEFLKGNFDGSSPADLNDHVEVFVNSHLSHRGKQLRDNTLEFLQALCTGVRKGVGARTILDTLQRSLLSKIERLGPAGREQRLNKILPNQKRQYLKTGTIPPAWVQFKWLTEEAVRDCLDDLMHALSKASEKKSKK